MNVDALIRTPNGSLSRRLSSRCDLRQPVRAFRTEQLVSPFEQHHENVSGMDGQAHPTTSTDTCAARSTAATAAGGC
jgi:hypothetical protein